MAKATLFIPTPEQIANEDPSIYHLRQALKKSYKERFLVATRLYKIDKMLQKAVIRHYPDTEK